MFKKLLLMTLCAAIVGCKEKNTTSETTPQYEISDQGIRLTENSILKQRIQTASVRLEEYSFDLVTAGIVRSIPNHYAEIASPFAGRVLKSFVKLGEKVNVSAPVFEISAPDYFEAQKAYFDAKQEYKQTEINLRRQRDLLNNGVGVQQEVEEAETEFETAKAAYQNAAAALRIFNVNPDQITLGQPLIVRSPIQGEVIENNIVIGQYITEDAEPIAKIASLETVWIVGKVKEKDIQHLTKLNKVQVELSAYPNQPMEGRIHHINEIVDEETRSIEVLIEVENTERKLKPGMYVNVRFIDTPESVIFVPAKAILQDEDDAFVFVKTGEDQYAKRKVKTGGLSGENAVVLEGLQASDEVVSEGGIYLLQAL